MTHSAYIVEEEDSEAYRRQHLKLFNEFVEWSVFNGSRPSPIFFSGRRPSIFEMITQMPIQGEFFPQELGARWMEDEYIPINRSLI